MTDQELELRVADELSWDPRVDNEAITVSAHDGIVTLRGTVAWAALGVTNVDDRLEVSY